MQEVRREVSEYRRESVCVYERESEIKIRKAVEGCMNMCVSICLSTYLTKYNIYAHRQADRRRGRQIDNSTDKLIKRKMKV